MAYIPSQASQSPPIERPAILAELRALAENVPNFQTFSPSSAVHHRWLAKVRLFISLTQMDSSSFHFSALMLSLEATRSGQLAEILAALHHAIATLEYQVLSTPQPSQVFGPGAVYDFHKTLRGLLTSVTHSLLIVDPYLDEEIFDAYLSAVTKTASVRLLMNKNKVPAGMSASLTKFVTQNQMKVEARHSSQLHDRALFLDEFSCWVLGQSIKDAAKSKPTYLAPLDASVARLKKAIYDDIWVNAAPI